MARFIQDEAGTSLKKIITMLPPMREFTGRVVGQEITYDPEVTEKAREITETMMPRCRPGTQYCGIQILRWKEFADVV